MVELILDPPIKERLWRHLLPNPHRVEEAAFVFAKVEERDHGLTVVGSDSLLLRSHDFAVQTSMHIELSAEVQGRAIRAAHQSNTILIEFHSHLGCWPAEFSISDRAGFNDWVPYVRWRLKGAPYGAVVVTQSTFEGLFWRGEGIERIDRIRSGNHDENATSLTELEWPFNYVLDRYQTLRGVGNE